MLAGLPVSADAVDELAGLVREVGADDLADRLERALADDVKLLALTLDERALMLSALEDPPPKLGENADISRTTCTSDRLAPPRSGSGSSKRRSRTGGAAGDGEGSP